MIYLDGDPQNQILVLRAAALSLFTELDFHPSGLQALSVPVELALLVVLALLGTASARGRGYSPLITCLLTLGERVRGASSTRGRG